jgi:hypothetical protein
MDRYCLRIRRRELLIPSVPCGFVITTSPLPALDSKQGSWAAVRRRIQERRHGTVQEPEPPPTRRPAGIDLPLAATLALFTPTIPLLLKGLV